MKSFFFIKYLFNSVLFYFFVKKNRNLESYFKWNNNYNNFIINFFFVCRILPAIFFNYYNKIVYIFSYLTFIISTLFSWIKPIILNFFKFFSIVLKFVIIIFIYLTPIVYKYLKK